MYMHDDGYPGMGQDAYGEWRMLLAAQRGIVDRRQALNLGFTVSQLEHRLKSGRWQRVHEGVYATFSGPLPRDAQLWAAVRRAGDGAMLSHQSAAEVQGLSDKPGSASVHVTVAARRRPVQRRPVRGIVVHRSDQSRPQFPGGSWKIPRTRIDDTVLDLVTAAVTFERGYSWIARAVAEDLVTVATLRAALEGRSRIRWRAWLADALEDSGDGVNSPLERRYVRDVERAHGLPKAERQARRTLGGRTHYKDNWYAEYRVAVEIDGPAYHQGDRAVVDRDRDNLNLAADAVQTLRFGPVGVTERACDSAALVAATLRRSGWTGNPQPCHRSGCAIARAFPVPAARTFRAQEAYRAPRKAPRVAAAKITDR
jgi:putative AbiEi antitoxin of type IV toxin-antitoxin system